MHESNFSELNWRRETNSFSWMGQIVWPKHFSTNVRYMKLCMQMVSALCTIMLWWQTSKKHLDKFISWRKKDFQIHVHVFYNISSWWSIPDSYMFLLFIDPWIFSVSVCLFMTAIIIISDEIPFEHREIKVRAGKKFEDIYECQQEVGK